MALPSRPIVWQAALIALLAGIAGRAAAAPVDAMPLERPGTRMLESPVPPPMPQDVSIEPPAAKPALPAVGQPDAPKLGATPLRAPEPALARVGFAPDDANLSGAALGELGAFATEFKRHAGRVTLKAYAGAVADTSTNARRLSLKRVLAVREYLLQQGVAPERLEVRALGGARDSGPPDRVDITRVGG